MSKEGIYTIDSTLIYIAKRFGDNLITNSFSDLEKIFGEIDLITNNFEDVNGRRKRWQ